MTDEIITTELEHPDEEFERSVDEDEKVLDEEFAREQEEISKTVLESAHELEQLSGEKLVCSLAGELTGMATTPATNPMEIIINTPAPGSRYEVLRAQLASEVKLGGAPSINRAKTELLTTLLGHDLTEGMAKPDARSSATTLLTHLVYAAKGQPLPELAISPAAQAVIDVGGKLSTMSDSAFWDLFATAHDGTVANADELLDQLAVMGIAHELQPLKTQFAWPTGDAAALQVDELVAAATIDPDYVDLSELYQRAGTLTLDGQPIPRAVMTELVRIAVADLIVQSRWKPAEARTPDTKEISKLLGPEPVSTDPKAADRNDARNSAKAVLEKARGSTKGELPELVARQSETRASRGYLREAVDYLLTRVEHATSAMPGGSSAAAKLDAAVQKSSLLPALEAWSAAYRSGESDPVKLKTLLDDVRLGAQALTDEVNTRFPNVSVSGTTPEANAVSFLEAVEIPLAEVALEAAELLRTPPSSSSDPLSGPATTVERNTVRSRARMAALRAINGEGGLPKFVEATVPKALQSESWATTLRAAAKRWTKAETRDANQVVKAASDFVDALRLVQTDLAKNWTPGTVFVGEGTVDALATALGEKIMALAATDPQIKAQTGKQLADLAKFQLSTQTIPDMAGYWRTTKAGIKNVPNVGLDFATKLAAWQKAAANPADTATLSGATYDVVDALIGNRLAIAGSSMSDADKAVLLRALDDLGAAVAVGMAALGPH